MVSRLYFCFILCCLSHVSALLLLEVLRFSAINLLKVWNTAKNYKFACEFLRISDVYIRMEGLLSLGNGGGAFLFSILPKPGLLFGSV